ASGLAGALGTRATWTLGPGGMRKGNARGGGRWCILAARNAHGTPFPMPRRYVQLDVFASRPGAGNPLAVVLDAEGLDDEAMQAIARWTRLPETTFVLPSDDRAGYRIRIFSPRREVPFAGHP